MAGEDVRFAITFLAAIGAGLVAGALFAFSTFVMPGLKRLPPRHGLEAMQQINITAVTPGFMAGFLGTAALGIVAGGWALFEFGHPYARWMLAGAVVYLGGVFGLTAAYHVPRNNALGELDPAAPDAVERWRRYYGGWLLWNHVRTVAGTLAMAAWIAALVTMD